MLALHFEAYHAKQQSTHFAAYLKYQPFSLQSCQVFSIIGGKGCSIHPRYAILLLWIHNLLCW